MRIVKQTRYLHPKTPAIIKLLLFSYQSRSMWSDALFPVALLYLAKAKCNCELYVTPVFVVKRVK